MPRVLKTNFFGEDFKIAAGQGLKLNIQSEALAGATSSGASSEELNALRAQLSLAISKQDELTKSVTALSKEKANLEAKLANTTTASAATGKGADSKALSEANDKIAKLESRLAEYEVIEDDLANLKKYQQENKQLRAQLEALGKGGAAPALSAEPAKTQEQPQEPEVVVNATPSPSSPEPQVLAPNASEPQPSPISSAEESITETKAAEGFDSLVDKVEESLAPPTGASAVDPMAAAELAVSKPATDSAPSINPEVAAAAVSSVASPAADSAPKTEKSDADLLSEFERMLNS